MEEIRKLLTEIVKELFAAEMMVDVLPAPAETGADFASNVALKLAKVAHKAPMAIAEEIKAKWEENEGGFRVEVAAPGFLNFISPDEYFAEKIAKMAQKQGDLLSGISLDEYSGKMVVTEFSDPNPFKVLHVGHLYTSVVGDSISRLLERAGAKVVRVNFGGDVGLHVGKTIWAVKAGLQANSSENDLTIEEIAKCYVKGTQAYDEDEDVRAEINELNKIIYRLAELGEEKCQERLELEMVAEDFERPTAEIAQIALLYWQGRKLSYEYFKQFYAEIGVKFDKFYPESSVAGKGLEEVQAHVGAVYEESEGAIVYRGEKKGLHTRVFINAQGVPTYEAKDVGLIFTKWADWQFDESVVITGNEQTEYMKVVLASVAEYAPELVERTRHLTHGMVRLPGNVKMASRKGNFLKAVDVIDMVNRELAETSSVEVRPKRLSSSLCSDSRASSRKNEQAHSLLDSCEVAQGFGVNPRRDSGSSPEESRPAAINHMIALAALKYAFLKYKMGGDIVFDPKESVAVNGNSGVYLLYSVVRGKKILQKLADVERGEQAALNENEQKFVRSLSKKLVQYEEVLVEVMRAKAPYKLCTFLYELAQEFSRFYEQVRVVGGGHEDEMEKYVQVYVKVMEEGLGLLGIEVPEEM